VGKETNTNKTKIKINDEIIMQYHVFCVKEEHIQKATESFNHYSIIKRSRQQASCGGNQDEVQ
jgi:hypothetical protein